MPAYALREFDARLRPSSKSLFSPSGKQDEHLREYIMCTRWIRLTTYVYNLLPRPGHTSVSSDVDQS